MKLYLKKDYWYKIHNNSYPIVFGSKVEKVVKYLLHFLLKKTPVHYVNTKEVLKQKAYPPSIQRGSDGKIICVLPYAANGLYNLCEKIKNGEYRFIDGHFTEDIDNNKK